MSNLLKFEREGLDFPFYKCGVSKDKIILLIIGFLIPTIYLFSQSYIQTFIRNSIIYNILYVTVIFGVPFLVVLYASNWDLSIIIKKPIKKDIWLVIKLVIATFLFSMIMALITSYFFGGGTDHSYLPINNVLFYMESIFDLFGEELIKFLVFIVLFIGLYKYVNNRRNLIIVSTVLTLIYFGLIHYEAYSGDFVQILLIQGLGSVFTMYGYLKTKNILIPYMCHLIYDLLVIIIIII